MVENKQQRIVWLDELRGFAILAMIVHHLFLDIGDVMALEWGYTVFQQLALFQPVFWAIFIIISGICSRLSRNTVKRGLLVFGGGMLITAVTAVIMPLLHMEGNEIYFGILHCLGASMIITGLCMPLIEKINALTGMLLSALLFAVFYSVSAGSLLFGVIRLPEILYRTNYLMPFGFFSPTFHSADYFALLPWLFMFLFGAFLGKYARAGAFPAWTYRTHVPPLAFIGRHSLWFYLAHQAVIYAILYMLLFFLRR